MNEDFPELDLRNLPEPPQQAYQEVRGRVMAEIRRRKRITTALRAIAAVAASLLVVWCGSLWRDASTPVVGAPPLLAHAPAAPPIALPAPAVRRVAHHGRRRTGPQVLLAKTQPLMIRMETDDPNVVILWMVD